MSDAEAVRPEDLSSPNESGVVFYVGTVGTHELAEVEVPFIIGQGGSIGVPAIAVAGLARSMSADDILWIHPSDKDENKSAAELTKNNEAASNQTILEDGKVIIDHDIKQLLVEGRPVHITPAELGIVEHLSRKLGRPASREEILRALWGSSDYRTEKTIDVFVASIRRALGEDYRKLLITRHRIGYALLKNLPKDI